MVTALTNRIGDCLILVRIGRFIYCTSLNYFLVSGLPSSPSFKFFILLFIVAATTKRAQIPFSAWLPAAMAAPTPVSSLVHSSTLVTAGVYILIRLRSLLSIPFRKYLFIIGCLTITMARVRAFFETDIKKIIALSTLRQLGLIITAIGLCSPYLAFFHLLTHAFFKAIMFMAVGNLIHINSSLQDLRLTSIKHHILGPTLSFVLVANLRLIGLPYMGGFYSKDLILETRIIKNLSSIELTLIVISVSLTAIYTLRFFILVLWSQIKPRPLI